jgi:hypothetical protein
MIDDATLAAIGAAIVGFGIVAFVFRVQRELDVRERGAQPQAALERLIPDYAKPDEPGTPTWIPWADRLLIGAVTAAIVLVLFPISLAGSVSSLWGRQLPAAVCSGSAMALAGYIPALLAHYRFGRFGRKAVNFRQNPEPAERVIVIASVILGVAAAVGSFVLTS